MSPNLSQRNPVSIKFLIRHDDRDEKFKLHQLCHGIFQKDLDKRDSTGYAIEHCFDKDIHFCYNPHRESGINQPYKSHP